MFGRPGFATGVHRAAWVSPLAVLDQPTIHPASLIAVA